MQTVINQSTGNIRVTEYENTPLKLGFEAGIKGESTTSCQYPENSDEKAWWNYGYLSATKSKKKINAYNH
jgi:ribosome modulation factor